ncbi:uracil-DNA glycosylase [Alphaproteobacteria bacterium]|nr:uracil-DNA glycosylase [Alphaproteobacteria bacterium]
MDASTIQLHPSWLSHLEDEFQQEYMKLIKKKLLELKKNNIPFYPPGKDLFKAFNLTPLDQVKVVILGQDPYHGPNQAHGLCFSVPDTVKPPPSLVNIFKELTDDVGKKIDHTNGNLESWARQGVFLLNTTLTVEKSKPLSHQKLGWDMFTNKVISVINEVKDHVVFILWGSFAQSKKDLIDSNKHLILTAPHPSPLSAHRGFFGSKPFSKTNTFLVSKQIDMIQW